ncbi:hypothetical protein GCM10010116_27540 [Microbispora rosea subsp. aerata]|nr:hypothetical protein GCM10010116_27540 [Microbispora rosea subsp. aerata]GIH53971.1 hypothetical protein Mro02_08850 [Microbispora rosea subsp. aerata]GLJ84944.1 hypothetical protein GCM10017588_36720 [Microbispora rosea subsp. aerata]
MGAPDAAGVAARGTTAGQSRGGIGAGRSRERIGDPTAGHSGRAQQKIECHAGERHSI